ncbi:putative transcriptional regulatory protein [Teratosphaeria destructans]|uniref:Transcriptional regulatory protein n=1 Tax=Teratosphaeria destructans TaxID=418781 RepID=A0A9W7SWB2_9PEZI|nr:putative transcriptional regulatory protein [Teratosphaeria destructans]
MPSHESQAHSSGPAENTPTSACDRPTRTPSNRSTVHATPTFLPAAPANSHPPRTSRSADSRDTGRRADSPTHGSLIVGPTVAEDVQILENYLSLGTNTASRPRGYRTVFSANNDPVIYWSVPKRREGLHMAKDPGRSQLEVMEQVLGPAQDELITLFFRFVHPCFPIMDEGMLEDLRERRMKAVSCTLRCWVLMTAVPLWDRSPVLRNWPHPSHAFLANQALMSLQEDFMVPGMHTVCAAILDLLARPVKSVANNITVAARTVGLAHSLGLNRDPSSWHATAAEKSLRVRLWWAVLINDHWASLAHGTPPNIISDRYDVPIPDLATCTPSPTSDEERRALESFRQLCILTEVLSGPLNLVYSLKTQADTATRELRKAECTLDEWEMSVRHLFDLRPETEPPAGHCSLWLCFLSLKLLIQRLYLRLALLQPAHSAEEEKHYRNGMLRKAALAVLDFVIALEPSHCHEFWFAHVTHYLVTSTTILLRCTIEAPDPSIAHTSMAKLLTFRQKLVTATTEWGWDLADLCLERCSEAITRIAEAHSAADAAAHSMDIHHMGEVGSSDMLLQPLTDMGAFLPADSLDFPWEMLWDTFDGPSTAIQ